MRFRRIGIATIVLCGAMAIAGSQQATAQQARDYWLLNVSSDKTMIQYVDAESIVSVNGDVKRAWTWVFYSTGAPRFAGSQDVSLVEINCQTRQMHSLQNGFYDGRGSYDAAWSELAPAPWTYVAPGTFGEAEIQFICSDAATRASFGIPLGKGVTPEQHARQFDAQRSFDMPSFGEVVDRVLHDTQSSAAAP